MRKSQFNKATVVLSLASKSAPARRIFVPYTKKCKKEKAIHNGLPL